MNEAIKKKKSTGTLFSDLELFVQACGVISNDKESRSIADVANKIGISPTALTSCFRRLTEFYECDLTESKENVAGFTLTKAGIAARKYATDLFDRFNDDRDMISTEFSISGVDTFTICTSPYLLAHAFPAFVKSINIDGPSNTYHIECTEGHFTDRVITDIQAGKVDVAVLWGYTEKIQKAIAAKGISCVVASTKIEAVFAFGRNHKKFIEWEKTKKTPTAFLEEMDEEALFLLEPDHQPFYNEIPLPEFTKKGKRTEITSIASIIGSIRAGMKGAAILPAIYKDIDRYRREGNLYFVPLQRRREDADSERNKMLIDVIYMFKGKKPVPLPHKLATELPTYEVFFHGEDGPGRVSTEVYSCLRQIDHDILPRLGKPSSWEAAVSVGIYLTDQDIMDFKFCLHISPYRSGFSEPRWKLSSISLGRQKSGENIIKGDKPVFGGDHFTGSINTLTDYHGESRLYTISAKRIDNTSLCIVGKLSIITKNGSTIPITPAVTDSFSAVLGFLSPDKAYLSGVASGHDDSGSSPIVGSLILAKSDTNDHSKLNYEDMNSCLQAMKIRSHIRTDVRNPD